MPTTNATRATNPVPRVGVWAWSFVGVVAALAIMVTALAAVNEIMSPTLTGGFLTTLVDGLGALVVTSLLLDLPLIFTIVVVNFIGGYIPYIGAFLGGGLAVPATVIAADAVFRLRQGGVFAQVADRAEPVVRRALD